MRRTHFKPAPFMFDDFTKAMDTFLGKDMSELRHFGRGNFPAVNVQETENAFFIDLMAPGRNKADFNIELEKDIITISYQKTEETKEETGKFTRKEYRLTSFKRSFNLPETVNTDNISAQYVDGILKLTLPKKEEVQEAEKTKVIEIG